MKARRRQAFKGRGAVSNPAGRFESVDHEVFDDGWGSAEEEPEAPATELRADPARTVITRNRSPDIPFEASINPYRGCEHACPYCLDGDTPILMADGRHVPIKRLQPGDRIIGTRRQGMYRRYVETTVKAHWRTHKPAYRIRLADGTAIVASGDHRFLTERGWKYVTGTMAGHGRRPYLTPNNKLMGTGQFHPAPCPDNDYRLGYLYGLLRGDAHIGRYTYPRRKRGGGNVVYRFRLALADTDALDRAESYLRHSGVPTTRFPFPNPGRPMEALRTSKKAAIERIEALIAWPETVQENWQKGFLAGMFDAEGHCRGSILRILNGDPHIVARLREAFSRFEFRYRIETRKGSGNKPMMTLRILGGLCEQLRFFHTTDTAIARKRTPIGRALKSDAALRVVAIESLGATRAMYDITTGTGDFIANGVVSHNCFARPSHSYLDLSPGLDFETRIFYKDNAAERLEAELRKPGYRPTPISLGINTDAYQPAERRLRVTRSLLEVLWAYRHPVSLITKSALITRDLDILGPMAEHGLVSAAVSVTSLDPDTKRRLEPRTAGPAARLRTIRSLADAGVPTAVMAAPVIPAITDHELEAILAAAADAGARGAGYVLLRLPHELKQVFRDWLETHYPDRAEHVMSLVRQSRGGKDYDAAWGTRMTGTGVFADMIAQRFRAASRRHGLDRGDRAPLTTALFRVPPRSGDQMTLL